MAGVLKETASVNDYWLEPDSRTVEPRSLSVTNLTGRILATVPYSEHAGLELKLTPTAQTGILIDFGREVGGYPHLTFGTGRCRRVAAQAVESLSHLQNPVVAEAVSRLDPIAYAVHFKAREGERAELPHCGGFRYLWLYPERRGRATLTDVSVDYTPHIADRDSCGYFLSSDDQLNRAWYAGLHTVQMCTINPRLGGADSNHKLGHYDWLVADGARRDRLVWTADLSPSGAAIYSSFNEPAAIRDSLLSLSSYQEKSGYIPACSPGPLVARFAGGLLGDYTAWWVVVLYQYYIHTGDIELVRELFPVIKRALAYMHGQCRGGMYRQTPFNMWEWCFTVLRFGKPAYTNVLYYWALNCASSMAHDIAESDVSIGYVSRAFRLGEAIERVLLDQERGVLVDTTADRGRVPQDANSLAIVSGLSGEPQDAGRILEYLRDRLWVEWGSTNVDIPYYRLTPGVQPHNKRVIPFMNNYEVLARFSAGDDKGAVELVRSCWGGMVDTEPNTTFWEWKGRDGGVDGHITSLCHGWSAGVTPLLTKYVLGIRPSGPGFRSFKFDPRPVGLEWAEGRVPVPGGFIEARVEKKKGGGYSTSFKAPRGKTLAA
ncbi:MAG: alpha-L-rhamnosidase-related protein [Candidatus Geothermincolia bacterium]